MIYLGSIQIYNDGGDSVRLVVDTQPYLDQKYTELEASGETFPEALTNLMEQIEGLPE